MKYGNKVDLFTARTYLDFASIVGVLPKGGDRVSHSLQKLRPSPVGLGIRLEEQAAT